ncbi:NAD(P)-dependent oxidoreductase [Streptomyces sp. CA-181903]|uniref:NAD(P)-dependent oxidoreductase n=1 Tax=Streptomyces sp. CA-181903 TaxID=3240055 RepID=UPI003D9138D0
MADPQGVSKAHDVAVVGCGLMGSALVRALAAGGHSVAAWNRTPERAEALASDHVTPVRSVDDAVAGTRLVITCVLNHRSTLEALRPVRSWEGVTLADVGTTMPDEARAMERWAADRGARYLDGAILCFPRDIGSPEATVLYAGSPAAWSEHRKPLMALGGASRFLSDRVVSAGLVDVALAGGWFIASLGAYVEAATYMLERGVPARVLYEQAEGALRVLRDAVRDATGEIERGDFRTEQATLEIYARGGRAALGVMRADGHRARLLGAAVENLTEAEAHGLGRLAFSAQTKVARGTRPA